MATTRRKRRVVRTATAPVVEPEVDVEEEEVLEVEELEEEKAPAPAPKKRARRTRRVAKPKPEVEEVLEESEEDDEAEEEEAPAPKKRGPGRPRKNAAAATAKAPANKKPRRARRVAKSDPVPEPEDMAEAEEVVEKIGAASAAGMMDILIRLLDSGQSIVISKVNQKYIMTTGGGNVTVEDSGRKIRGGSKRRSIMTKNAMRIIAQTEEYKEYNVWWKSLTFEEKVKEANEVGATWEEHEHPLTHNLRVTMAYQGKVGIIKWKPEYQAKDARDALLYEGIEADEYEAED